MKKQALDKEQIYKDYYLKVRNFVLSKINDMNISEDLTSDIFVKIYENIDRFDEKKASISTWVFTITRHKLIDYYRTRKISVELPADLTYEDEDEKICNEDNLAILKEGLKKLNEKERDIIILHYYSNISLKDIAVKLNISYIYAKVLHQKALTKLKGSFDNNK